MNDGCLGRGGGAQRSLYFIMIHMMAYNVEVGKDHRYNCRIGIGCLKKFWICSLKHGGRKDLYKFMFTGRGTRGYDLIPFLGSFSYHTFTMVLLGSTLVCLL